MAKPIQDLTKDALNQPQSDSGNGSRAKYSDDPPEWLDRLFIRLSAEFGPKFTSHIPTEEAERAVMSIWAERLAGLSLAEIKKGVDGLARHSENNNGFPPGAAEFYRLCRPHREPYEREEFQAPRIEQDKASRETAREHLAKIKRNVKLAPNKYEKYNADVDDDG